MQPGDQPQYAQDEQDGQAALGELESRLRSLRIAAQKAERYKRYRAELRDLEL